MPNDLSELQGEVLALRCHIAALIEVLPFAAKSAFERRLESCAALLRPCQKNAGQAGFDRVMVSLGARRRISGEKPQQEATQR